MQAALVFASPAPLFPVQTQQSKIEQCKHLKYTLDAEDGYTCDDCGVQLIFCLACMYAIMDGRTTNSHVHMFPPCDDLSEHHMVPSRTDRKRVGLGS